MRIHFIGIGGAGMSALAMLYLSMGEEVSGSDPVENEAVRRLRARGAKVFKKHRAKNIKGADIVVYSSAIPPDNVELIAAKEAGIPLLSRGEMLARLVSSKKSIVVCGSHGKTTTSSLVSLMLQKSGLEPTIMIGGEVSDIGGNARLGKGELVVSEADESDGSFLFLSPWIAVITNIDSDHLNYYGSLDNLVKAFAKFASNVREDGYIVACYDDPHVRGLHLPRPPLTYGLDKGAHIWAGDIKVSEEGTWFSAYKGGDKWMDIRLSILGRQNVYNALATLAVGSILGLEEEKMKESLETFKGVHRRLEKIGSLGDVLIYDDYAHHPTEISFTLKALKEAFPGRRLVCAFQPHRYTRTQLLYREIATALKEADLLLVTDIYSAGEPPIKGVSSLLIVESLLEEGKKVEYVKHLDDLPRLLLQNIAPGDVVIVMGAGNINEYAYEMLRMATTYE